MFDAIIEAYKALEEQLWMFNSSLSQRHAKPMSMWVH